MSHYTRWNTLASMIDRFLMLFDDVRMAVLLMNKKWPFNDDGSDKQRLINLRNALKSMELAIKKLGSRETNLLGAEKIYQFIIKQLPQVQLRPKGLFQHVDNLQPGHVLD